MLYSDNKLYGDTNIIFQENLTPGHYGRSTNNCFNHHGITVLDLIAIWPDLNGTENLWSIGKTKVVETRVDKKDELKAASKTTRDYLTTKQCHKMITSMLHCTLSFFSVSKAVKPAYQNE